METSSSEPHKQENEDSKSNTGISQQEIDDNLPEYLKTLLAGRAEKGDTGNNTSYSKPDWFDEEKFNRGKQFACDYFFGVWYSLFISMNMIFLFTKSADVMIFTGQSVTPQKAFRRYLLTMLDVTSWYEGDIWDKTSVAHKRLRHARFIHNLTQKKMNSCPKDELVDRLSLSNTPLWTDRLDICLEDFQRLCPIRQLLPNSGDHIYLNQFDMALQQLVFVGLLLAYPKKLGIHSATEADFEGFAHFWHVIGYLLGTDDRYNLCNGDIGEIRQRIRDMIEHWVKPLLVTMTRECMHLSRCMAEAVKTYTKIAGFDESFVYLCDIIDVPTPLVYQSLTFFQTFMYYFTVYFFKYVFRLPGMWTFTNFLVSYALKVSLKNLNTPEVMELFYKKEYSYQKMI